MSELDIRAPQLPLHRRLAGKVRRLGFLADAALAFRGVFLTPRFREVMAYRDRYRGRIGFLIGNGPSVRIEDLEQMGNGVTFCCNRFYLAYERMKFRPTFLCSCDPQMILDFGQEMIDRGESTVWFVNGEPVQRNGSYLWLRSKERPRVNLRRNVLYEVSPGGATLIAAAQIGYFMGIRHFVLYGVDHTFKFQTTTAKNGDPRSAIGEGNHFIAGYRSGRPWVPPAQRQIEEGWQSMEAQLRREGGWMVNATRGGALEVLPRRSLEEILGQIRAGGVFPNG